MYSRYPTIVHGIAGLEVGIPADGSPPLDGVDAWPSITSGGPSERKQTLLQLNPAPIVGDLPQAALRVGDFKLIVGKPAVFGAGVTLYSGDHCSGRDDHVSPTTFPYRITNATSPAFCPNGWVPPPESGNPVRPPPDVSCPPPAGSPCYFPNTSYTDGSGVFLYNISNDPTEETNLAAQLPTVVKDLLDQLMVFVNKSIPQDHGGKDPRSDPATHGGVWTPWIGDPNPANCQAVPAPPVPPPRPCGGDGSEGDGLVVVYGNGSCHANGWCSGPQYGGPPRTAEVSIDGVVVVASIANLPRKIAGLHGFDITFNCEKLSTGDHEIVIACKCSNPALPPQNISNGNSGPTCTHGPPVHVVPCPSSLHQEPL